MYFPIDIYINRYYQNKQAAQRPSHPHPSNSRSTHVVHSIHADRQQLDNYCPCQHEYRVPGLHYPRAKIRQITARYIIQAHICAAQRADTRQGGTPAIRNSTGNYTDYLLNTSKVPSSKNILISVILRCGLSMNLIISLTTAGSLSEEGHPISTVEG